MSWKQALQAYTASRWGHSSTHAAMGANRFRSIAPNRLSCSTRAGDPSPPYDTVAARANLYETVARAHLFGPIGFRLHPQSLSVLRELRWSLLREGTPWDQSELLEHILQLFSEADGAHLYDPVPSSAERQCLILEQLQCIVEAKVTGLPLGPRHYRYPLQSPQLAAVNPDLSLLLLDEMKNSVNMNRSHTARTVATPPDRLSQPNTTPLEEEKLARWDCAVGLASAGHTDLALRLCSADGFPYVVDRVARQRRGGWHQAWQLAERVPLDSLLSRDPAHSGWLTGVLDAAVREYQATSSTVAQEWLKAFMALHKKEVHSDGSNDSVARQQVPLQVMETYLTVCIPTGWREAKAAVLAYNAESVHTGTPRVGLGRLMTLLQLAQQPLEVLKLFYGDNVCINTTEQGLGGMDPTQHICIAQGRSMSAQDLRHPAVSNHTMVALAQSGLWQCAMQYYQELPPQRVNRHTHWSAARMLVIPSNGVVIPRNNNTYALCITALDRAAARVASVREGDGNRTAVPSPWESFSDAEALCEAVALWSTVRGDWQRTSQLAARGPRHCRYVQLIALEAALQAGESAVAATHYASILSHPRCSLKQACLGLAMLANSSAASTLIAVSPAAEGRPPLSTAAVLKLLGFVQGSQNAMDELIRVLVEYFIRIEQQQEQQQQPLSEASISLVRTDILKSTIGLMRTVAPSSSGWPVLLQVLRDVGSSQGLSIAKAAPAMVSAGARPEVAINFLCN